LPHTPLSQMAEQHWLSKLHPKPSGVHCGVVHTPFWQLPEQQSPPTLHLLPLGTQVMHCARPQIESTSLTQMLSHPPEQQKLSILQIAVTHGLHPDARGGPAVHGLWVQEPVTPQTSLSQAPVQHSPALLQALPSPLQAPPQTPLAPQIPEQHCLGFWQKAPLGAHMLPPHTPLMHGALQQPADVAQDAPLGAHMLPPHTPLMHGALQQPADVAQDAPMGPHMLPPQTLPLQTLLQHSSSTLHELPSSMQVCPPQTPFLQLSGSQQSAPCEHKPPPGTQRGPSGEPPLPRRSGSSVVRLPQPAPRSGAPRSNIRIKNSQE
jgi:hypothetical protein